MEDLLILYSGGADSRLLLELALRTKKNPYCVLVDYEQKHDSELEYGIKQLIELKIPYQVISIRDLKVNSGLTGNCEESLYEGVHEKHVPGRNSIFLSLALSISESKNINTIWYGADYSDSLNKFPDCYQQYVVKISNLFKIAGSFPIKVEAPLLGMTKELVLQLLDSYGINRDSLFSGYGEI